MYMYGDDNDDEAYSPKDKYTRPEWMTRQEWASSESAQDMKTQERADAMVHS